MYLCNINWILLLPLLNNSSVVSQCSLKKKIQLYPMPAFPPPSLCSIFFSYSNLCQELSHFRATTHTSSLSRKIPPSPCMLTPHLSALSKNGTTSKRSSLNQILFFIVTAPFDIFQNPYHNLSLFVTWFIIHIARYLVKSMRA